MLKKSLVTGFIFGMASTLSLVASAATPAPAAKDVVDVNAGKEKAAACAACHGADGNSASPTFPKIAGQNSAYLLKQLKDIKSGARSIVEMTGQLDNMSEQDLKNIAAYYAGQKQTGGIAKDDKDSLKLGERLYRAGDKSKNIAACTACHSPTGKGNAPAGFPVLGGQHAAYIAKQLKAFRLGYDQAEAQGARTNGGEAKIMRTVSHQLSDLEIEALANYISGLY